MDKERPKGMPNHFISEDENDVVVPPKFNEGGDQIEVNDTVSFPSGRGTYAMGTVMIVGQHTLFIQPWAVDSIPVERPIHNQVILQHKGVKVNELVG